MFDSECLSNSSLRRVNYIRVIQENMLLHSLIGYIRVASYFFDATIKWDYSSASPMGLKTIYTSLLILRVEQPFPAINALSKSFFSPTETGILNGHGYISAAITEISTNNASLAILAATQARAGACPSGTQASHTAFISAK